LFFSVPRFYEKVHEGIQARLETQTGLRRRIATAALASGREHSTALGSSSGPGWWLRLRYAVLDRLVLQRIRAAFGGNIKWMITGSAAAPVWLLEFFHGIGLPLLEAYGITENPVPIAANRPYAYRFGSVGKPFSINHLRLSADGEVLVKGPALFRGYRGEDTARALFTDDGFYRTGDLGRLDEDGFLFLTGRLAELIKTSTGRRVSPVGIEEIYRRCRYIEHVVVIGNNRPYLTALVTPNAAAIRAALRREDTEAALPSADMLRVIEPEFANLANHLARHEQVRTVRLLPEPLAAENGTLTATLKLRRAVIETRYAALIEEMYRGAANLRNERTS
jgi:long-chain acyl-CoA synthetase